MDLCRLHLYIVHCTLYIDHPVRRVGIDGEVRQSFREAVHAKRGPDLLVVGNGSVAARCSSVVGLGFGDLGRDEGEGDVVEVVVGGRV